MTLFIHNLDSNVTEETPLLIELKDYEQTYEDDLIDFGFRKSDENRMFFHGFAEDIYQVFIALGSGVDGLDVRITDADPGYEPEDEIAPMAIHLDVLNEVYDRWQPGKPFTGSELIGMPQIERFTKSAQIDIIEDALKVGEQEGTILKIMKKDEVNDNVYIVRG